MIFHRSFFHSLKVSCFQLYCNSRTMNRFTCLTSVKLSISGPVIFSGAQSHYYAWYVIPYYGFLFLVLGIFLDDFRKNPDFISAATIFIFIVVWSVNLNIKDWVLSSPYGRYYFIIGTAIILGGFFFNDLTEKKSKILTNFVKIIMLIVFLGLLLGNLNLILNYKLPS